MFQAPMNFLMVNGQIYKFLPAQIAELNEAPKPSSEQRELWVKWIEALRSGQYKQGYHALRTCDLDDTYAYCCLGVLCNLKDPNGWQSFQRDEYSCEGMVEEYDEDSDTMKPGTINGDLGDYNMKIFGIPDALQNYVITANDNGMSFQFIANVLEGYMNGTLEFVSNEVKETPVITNSASQG